MKDNIPEIGDLIQINPECIEETKKRGNKLYLASCKNKFLRVKSLQSAGDVILIFLETKEGATLAVCLNNNGTPRGCTEDFKTPMFIPAGPVYIQVKLPNSIYCSCNGPSKQSQMFSGKTFYICRVCRKEKSPK